MGHLWALGVLAAFAMFCVQVFLVFGPISACAVSIGFPLGRLAAVGAVVLRGLNVLCMPSLWVSTA